MVATTPTRRSLARFALRARPLAWPQARESRIPTFARLDRGASFGWRADFFAKVVPRSARREGGPNPESRVSVRPRQPEHVLGDISENQVGRDRSDLIQARLAGFPLDIVFLSKSKAAVGLNRDIRGLPRCIRRQELRHVRLGSAWLAAIEQLGSPDAHQVGCFHVYVCPCDGELDPLVLADRTVEDDAFLRVLRGAFDEPPAVANTFGSYQNPLGVQPVNEVPESLAFFTDQGVDTYLEIVEEELRRCVIHHRPDRADRQALPHGLSHVDQQH